MRLWFTGAILCLLQLNALAELAIKVTYPVPATPTQEIPRVYLALTQSKREPRTLISDWFALPTLFALDDTDRDGTVIFDSEAQSQFGNFQASLDEGDYTIQAVVRLNDFWPMPGTGDGDHYSAPTPFNLAEDSSLHLEATTRHTIAPARTTGSVIDGAYTSKLLSEFHETPYEMRYSVILPEGWSRDKSYPVVVYIFGFSGVHSFTDHVKAELGEPVKDVITIIPDANCYWGHSVFADSATNGPWGTALVNELLPSLEKQYGGMGAEHRYVTGVSSGGWSSLWLQLTYPREFAGCWSYAPDPLDFSTFLTVDLYKDASLYHDSEGKLVPMSVPLGPDFQLTFQQFGTYEKVLGVGGQLQSFNATFSPLDDQGHPIPWFDLTTGKINHSVIQQWKPYEMTHLLRQQWQTHQKDLKGKIHLAVHHTDAFFLNHSVDQFAKVCKQIKCDAEVRYFDGIGHHMPAGATNPMFEHILKRATSPAQKRLEKSAR